MKWTTSLYYFSSSLLVVATHAQLRGTASDQQHEHHRRLGTTTVEFDPYSPDPNGFQRGLFSTSDTAGSGQIYGLISTVMATGDWQGLQLGLADEDDVDPTASNTISAGWKIEFDTTEDTDVELSFQYQTFFEECFGQGDVGLIMVDVDTVGAAQTAYYSTTGPKGPQSSWTTFTTTFAGLGTGTHNLELGAMLNYGSSTNGDGNCATDTQHQFQVRFEAITITVNGIRRDLLNQGHPLRLVASPAPKAAPALPKVIKQPAPPVVEVDTAAPPAKEVHPMKQLFRSLARSMSSILHFFNFSL